MLNDKQEKAANFINGQMLVVSCPGSGKTTVIVERVKRLIQSGVCPENILVITFTKEAALQMKERYERTNGKSAVFFGTIHSICFRVLARAFGYQKENILLELAQKEFFQKFFNTGLGKKVATSNLNEFIENLTAEISYIRNNGTSYKKYIPQNSEREVFIAAYEAYEKYKKDEGKIDFDDMLILCQKCFHEMPEELAYWQEKFKYIMIDEFQDTNKIQADIFYELAGENGNIFVVGDDDQSIYRFRSADSSIMLDFPKKYKDCSIVYMDTNYRSTPEIIKNAAKLISHNEKRFKKEFKGNRKEQGGILLTACEGQALELKELLKDIDTKRKQGETWTDMAVLYRTNMENQLLIGKLMKLKIPFYTTEAIKDYHQDFIFQDILAYYRLASGKERKGDLQRILNRPSRYLKADVFKNCNYDRAELFKACEKLGDRAEAGMVQIHKLLHDIEMLKGKSPIHFVTTLLMEIGYTEFIDNYCDFVSRDREAARQLSNLLAEEAKEFETMEEWQAYAKFYGETLLQKKREKKKEGICLSTFHSSKGLEWKHVFILNANEGMCPHKKAETKEDYEEERRLFYVALTRAKDNCRIYYLSSDGNKKQDASRYLYEMGLIGEEERSGKIRPKIV